MKRSNAVIIGTFAALFAVGLFLSMGSSHAAPSGALQDSPVSDGAPSFAPRGLAECQAMAGEIRAWAGPPDTVPPSWFICNGAQVHRDDAPELFAVIGTSWGGDGVPFFNLPDLRGRFLRGVDSGSGQDPDRFTRTSLFPGGNTGALVGSYQADATARPNNPFTTNSDTHSHQMMGGDRTGNSPGPGNFLQGTNNPQSYGNKQTGTDTHNHTVSFGGDAETRPTNVYVHYIIFGGCDLLPVACVGDLSGDGVTDLNDFASFAEDFGCIAGQ